MPDLLQILIETGKISEAQRQEIITKAQVEKKTIEAELMSLNLISETDFYKTQAASLGVEYIDLTRQEIAQEVLNIIPEELAQNYRMIAFDRKSKLVFVALTDPKNFKAREAVEYMGRNQGFRVKYFLTNKASFEYALKQYASIRQEVTEALTSVEEKFQNKEEDDDKNNDNLSDDKKIKEIIKHAPIAKMVSVILRNAIEGNASDIHIEPLQTVSRIRYRLDGELKTTITLPLYLHSAIIARIKIMSNLKIDETRIPQDGRFRLHLADKEVDFRVSVLPLLNREKAAIRILNTEEQAPTLFDLGFRAGNLEIMQRNILKPNGIFLITGPTGSGKSMTLFSTLSILNTEHVNISTLEDPIEYKIGGVNQSQIHPEIGYTFATGLRSILRQDPDIIMVGEIRDNETAELAMQAAMTGHLVLSTLHTNDAIGAIPRLIDMKVAPFLISTTINILAAQRLVRKICKECKTAIKVEAKIQNEILNLLEKIPAELLKKYGDINLNQPIFYRGQGCSRCGNTGYRGRLGICEVIEATARLRQIITQSMQKEEIIAELVKQNFINLRQDGLIKALLGITTIEEILSVTKEET